MSDGSKQESSTTTTANIASFVQPFYYEPEDLEPGRLVRDHRKRRDRERAGRRDPEDVLHLGNRTLVVHPVF